MNLRIIEKISETEFNKLKPNNLYKIRVYVLMDSDHYVLRICKYENNDIKFIESYIAHAIINENIIKYNIKNMLIKLGAIADVKKEKFKAELDKLKSS